MMQESRKYSKVPRYHSLRIYLVSTVLYFFLVFPVAGILAVKYVPDYMSWEKRTSLSQFQELRRINQLNEKDSIRSFTGS
jgi:hypothetical protein